MKFCITLCLLVASIALTHASEKECRDKYGPPPSYGGGYGGGSYGGGSYGGGYNGGYRGRSLTFHYDVRCEKYGYKNYRKLAQARDVKVVTTQELVATHGDTCSDAQYDIYLVIQGAHFVGLGTPIGEKFASCPNVVMHSQSFDDEPMEKVVMIAGNKEVSFVADDEKYHVGSRTLKQIVAAFDGVEAGKNGQKFYDAITNNCVSLLRNMADPLDISIDDGLIKFVSHRLLQSSADHVFSAIRESPAMKTLYEGGQRMLKGVSKEDMLAKLIKLYV